MLKRRLTFLTISFSFCTIVYIIFHKPLHEEHITISNNQDYTLLGTTEALTTIITAYYPLGEKAKHSTNKYQEWLVNLLRYADNPMVIFTSDSYVSVLRSIRGQNMSLATLFITHFSSALDIPPVQRLQSTFQLQQLTDPERSYHTVDLYAVWCAKSFILNFTATLNPFKSTYFIYVDAGAFRNTNYRFKKWPDDTIVSKIFDTDDRLLLSMVYRLPKRFCNYELTAINQLNQSETLIQGGIIGGSAASIRWWSRTYYDMCDVFVRKGKFIGKDQNVMNAIALTYPTRIKVILSFRIACGNIWFAFGPLLANPFEKNTLFGSDCRTDNINELIRPFEMICRDPRNLI